VGGDFKDAMAEPGRWSIGGTAFGEMLPHHDNKVTLDHEKRDKWGLPVLKIDCEIRENEHLMRRDMIADMAEMLSEVGVSDVHPLTTGIFREWGFTKWGRAHGPRPEVVRAQQVEPGLGCAERLRDRWLVHGLQRVSESVAGLHGAHGACVRARGERAESAKPVG